ncbi:cytochrome P450 [Kitasatospora sp. NPDC088861]|uniref:cytochrome P450 n=1 Tax=Kitasatospora sp. NPDC088861 TaxID=3364078 RepID=UPI00381989DE
MKRYRRYGPVSRATIVGNRAVFLAGPEAVAPVLANHDRVFASGPGWNPVVGSLLPDALSSMDAAEHLYWRRIIQSAFSRDSVRGHVENSAAFTRAQTDTWQTGDGFRLQSALERLMVGLSLQEFTSTCEIGRLEELNEGFKAISKAAVSPLRIPLPGSLWARAAKQRATLETYFGEMITAKQGTSGDLLARLATLPEAAHGGRSLANFLVAFLIASYGTTANTLASACYFLARHPEWQDRVRAECLSAGTPELGLAPTDRLKDLDRVLKETLRLLPPVFIIPRAATRDTEILGHRIPAGTFVAAQIMLTQRLPEIWPDPDRFAPDRFDPAGRTTGRQRDLLMPYGSGVHKCIGLHLAEGQMRTIMYHLLTTFRWSIREDRERAFDFSVLHCFADGLPVRLDRLPG